MKNGTAAAYLRYEGHIVSTQGSSNELCVCITVWLNYCSHDVLFNGERLDCVRADNMRRIDIWAVWRCAHEVSCGALASGCCSLLVVGGFHLRSIVGEERM